MECLWGRPLRALPPYASLVFVCLLNGAQARGAPGPTLETITRLGLTVDHTSGPHSCIRHRIAWSWPDGVPGAVWCARPIVRSWQGCHLSLLPLWIRMQAGLATEVLDAVFLKLSRSTAASARDAVRCIALGVV